MKKGIPPAYLMAALQMKAMRKRLAKAIVRTSFRDNSALETLHVDGKITQEEMRDLMVEAVNNCYAFLGALGGIRGRRADRMADYVRWLTGTRAAARAMEGSP